MRNFFSALLRKIAEMLEKTDYKAGNLKISSQKAYELETSREEEKKAPIKQTQSVVNELSPPKVKETRENTLQKKKNYGKRKKRKFFNFYKILVPFFKLNFDT